MSSTAVVPRACLTLNPNVGGATPAQACPDVTGLSFPLELVSATPNDPCGGATPCTATRTVRCMPAASTCPFPFTLQLFRSPSAAPAATPELVECR
jgi:hypothetical protein